MASLDGHPCSFGSLIGTIRYLCLPIDLELKLARLKSLAVSASIRRLSFIHSRCLRAARTRLPHWPLGVLPSGVIVRLIAAGERSALQIVRKPQRKADAQLQQCHEVICLAGLSSAHPVSRCSTNSPEKPFERPRNGCAPEWLGATDRYCGFLTANECDEVCAAIKSTPSSRRSSRSELSLTHQIQHSVKNAMNPAF